MNLFKSGSNFINGIATTERFSYYSGFSKQLQIDCTALRSYQQAVENGTNSTTAIGTAMQNASLAAKNFANSNEITRASIRDFVTSQKQSQVTMFAASSSIKNQSVIIKAYNNCLSATRLTQDQFRDAVSASNPALGRYLSSVKAGEATTRGYIASLVSAKIASIGLKVATVALNMALASLISVGISAGFKLITDAINASKKSIEDATNSIGDLKDSLKSLDEYRDRIIELRTALDKGGLSIDDVVAKRGELFEIQKQLIDKYGDEARGVDFVTGSLERQIAIYDELKKEKAESWLLDNSKGIQNAYNFLYADNPDPGRNYLMLEPQLEGYRRTGTFTSPTGVSKFLSDWIKANRPNVVQEWEGAHEAGIRFTGNRMEIIEAYDKLLNDLKTYNETQKELTEQDKQNIEALKRSISGAKKYITENETYGESVQTYTQAIEYVAQVESAYKKYYDEIIKYQEEYDNAVIEGNKDAAEDSYIKVQEAYANLFKNADFSQTLNSVQGKDVKKWFEDQLQDFINLSVPVHLEIDLEGSKQEFRSSYEELAKIYAKVGDEGFNFDEDSFDILEHYNEVLKEAKESGVDLNKTVFGNIDTNNRQLLEWTEENLNKYKDAYESLGWTAEELKGSISTVMGMADKFDGVNIAFTPMLQTDHGAVLLDADTVHEYIWALIDQMPEGWTNEDLLKLDAEGIEMDGQKIKGLIADIGETAIKTSESMHFAGKDGAIADAYKYWQEYVKKNNFSNISIDQASEFNAIRDAANEAGVSIESYIEALVKCGKVRKKSPESGTEELSISKYSEEIKKAQETISPLLDAYNKLQKGELSSSDIITLISDKFPSLINYTDDLGVGIQKLAWEKLEALKNKLNEIDKSKLSKSDLEAYNKFIEYIDNLNDGFRSTLAYYEKIQATTKKVSESITTLISLSKEIDEDGGLSLSSIDKIMSDESLASLRPYLNDVKSMLPIINSMIEEQKQAYVELYNEQQRLADPEAYKEAAEEKVEADEKAFSNAIKKIDDAVKHFKEKYDVDVTNWEQIEDGKKAILENTNAQLVGKQQKLINDFAKYYNTDLENFKNITEAKQAILDEFATSKAGQAINDFALNMYQGRYVVKEWDSLTSVEQKIVQQYLTQLGWTYNDYKKFAESGFKEVTSKGDESLKKKLAEIVTAYTISPDTWNDATKNIGSSSKGSSSKEKTWFEKQYAYHNHMVNMEQEKQQDYLNWLDGAYKQAYNQGIIDLDAYYKYEEEVYNGRKKLAGDTSNWFEKQYKEHQHLLKMEKEDEADYLKWLDAAYKKAYAEGLITLDDYRKYQEEVYEGVKRLKDNAESAIKELINIRINMLKEEVNKEKESINKRLDMLKDFYQKQKDMLQDKYDQEKYLDEQNEKRKKVSDIQAEIEALRMDDSAKAQKKRAELAVDLKDAQKELNDFEKDHTLKEAQDQLDKLYENQEKEYNKKLDDLEKKVSSPQELYEQALADIRNGSQSLYNQMIEWNSVYGDGIRETITKAWEEAYKAEKQYFNYTGKHFNDVNLSNATGYVKGKSGYASGTRHSIAGLHRVDEQGIETIFQSADGQRYRMFSSGEKVLNANASDFLYKFANKGKEILENLFHGTSRSYNNVNPGVAVNNVQLGDIIIQGNADRATVSEIRRAQRENLEQMLKQFNRLK